MTILDNHISFADITNNPSIESLFISIFTKQVYALRGHETGLYPVLCRFVINFRDLVTNNFLNCLHR